METDKKTLALVESYLDEMLQAEADVDHTAFTRRFDPVDVEHFGESRFRKDMFSIREDFGDYLGREYMGCLKGRVDADRPERHAGAIRHVWRGRFEKNEIIIVVGVFPRDDAWLVCEFTYR